MGLSRGRWDRRARLCTAGAALLLGIALAGCSPSGAADPGPAPVPSGVAESPRPSPSPSASPTPDASVKPERPAAMDQVGVEGAEAVATYFLQLYPYVYATGDLTEWQALSHPECVFCASVVTNVEVMREAGQHAEGGRVEMTDFQVSEIDPGRWFSVDVTLAQEPSVTVDANGTVVESFPDHKVYDTGVAVVFENSQWTVRAVDPTRG